MDGLFGDGLIDVLCCGGDSLEEDLHWGPRLGALVDLVEFDDGVTSCGVTLFKTIEAKVMTLKCSFFHPWFTMMPFLPGWLFHPWCLLICHFCMS